MDGLRIFSAADHADLDGRNRHVFQYGACLDNDMDGINGTEINYVTAVLCRQCRNDGGCMTALAGQCFYIGLHAGTAAGVMARERQNNRECFHSADNKGAG